MDVRLIVLPSRVGIQIPMKDDVHCNDKWEQRVLSLCTDVDQRSVRPFTLKVRITGPRVNAQPRDNDSFFAPVHDPLYQGGVGAIDLSFSTTTSSPRSSGSRVGAEGTR